MGLLSTLKHYLFYVIDKRTSPPEITEFGTRGQAVTAGRAISPTCRHGKGRLDNCYVIPKSKGAKRH